MKITTIESQFKLKTVPDGNNTDRFLAIDANGLVKKVPNSHTDNLITQLKGGTPLDADTLKKINDKVIALQSIVGGTTPDGDTVVNTLTELMAVLTNYPEGTDLFTLVSGKVAKTDIYNALDCVVAGKVADARQLKVLNDALTALTTAVNNKVDKAAGERLINAAEITKLSGLSNVITTVKTITSALLATQDIAGFVTYINTLGVVLAVGANEIVEYQLGDTGRIFKLLLRGRSFGTGQPAITSADVEEISLWMQKDLKLSNYPSTRNDGQLPTNKVLAPDVNGNIKLYTIATAPPPYMEVLIPDSTLPSTTTNFIIKGAFFTPTMTVSIVGQTINYITFVSDNLIKVNVTTSAAEGLFAVTLNNGISATFPNALMIVLGTVYEPQTSEWTLTEPINVLDGEVQTQIANSSGSAVWSRQFDHTKDWSLRYVIKKTPLVNVSSGPYYDYLFFKRVTDNAIVFRQQINKPDVTQIRTVPISLANGTIWSAYIVSDSVFFNNSVFEYRYVDGIMAFYVNNVLKYTHTDVITTDLYLTLKVHSWDVCKIKYIELAT